MPESFTRKRIEVSIQLAPNTNLNQPNTFAGTGSNTITITDKRMSVRIANSGRPTNSTASVSIYGMTESVMNQLSTLGMVLNFVPKNVITIKAGDDVVAPTVVFSGIIASAYADMAGAPDVPFIMECNSGLGWATQNTLPTSYKGTVTVATIISGFARQMGIGFENNGVDGVLTNVYYKGSLKAQLDECVRQANISAEVVNGNKLCIWPKFGSRTSITKVPVIAAPPTGGMIGRPSFTQQGVMVRNIFTPDIAFGAKVKIVTRERALERANGEWTVNKLDHALDAQVPKGQWASTIYTQGVKGTAPNPIIMPPK
jgi:hypothetical protein